MASSRLIGVLQASRCIDILTAQVPISFLREIILVEIHLRAKPILLDSIYTCAHVLPDV